MLVKHQREIFRVILKKMGGEGNLLSFVKSERTREEENYQ
jgi:hypothetical protein